MGDVKKNNQNAAVITAAGIGKRIAGEIPKQYITIGGKPILARTVENFERSSWITSIILVVESARIQEVYDKIVGPFGFRKVVSVISGGKHRQESVYQGIQAVPADMETISIQDGVRPFTPSHLIERCIKQARQLGAAVAAYTCRDSVKHCEDSRIVRTLDRRSLYLVQTPQTFRADLIRRAHEEAKNDSFIGTDDAVLVERLGCTVTVVESSPYNLKITVPEDLAAAEALVDTIDTFPFWRFKDA